MRSVRVALGIGLMIAGMALGLYVTVHYFGEGILLIREGQLQQGLIVLLVWSELLGIVATLGLVIPGVLVLKSASRDEPGGSPSSALTHS